MSKPNPTHHLWNAKVIIHKDPWVSHDGSYEIAVVAELSPSADGTGYAYAEPLVMKAIAPQGETVRPCMNFGKDTMQEFFNELWSLGFRPTDGTGNSGHIEAMKYHLEDMRKLVFKEKEL